MKAVILSIGDELVSGLTVNTNASWLSQQLAGLGVVTVAHVTVGDDLRAIVATIRGTAEQLELGGSRAPAGVEDRGGFLLITGGLGPTEDDLTRQGLAEALGQRLVEDPDAMVQIERFFKQINRPMSASNRLQAMRPEHCTVIENRAGTAPGLRGTLGDGASAVEIFVMPGVPREMREMFEQAVKPAVVERMGQGAAVSIRRVVKVNTFGMGESILGERIKDLMGREGVAGLIPEEEGGVTVGTTVHDGIVSVRIYAHGSVARVDEAVDQLRAKVRERLGVLVFGEEEDSLEGAVAVLMKEGRYTVSTAESCTGGLLGMMMTSVPGSSVYFQRGWVTYANESKHDEVGVPAELIERHGAVSGEVVRAMAEGARKFAETDFAVAITGVAGPDGGTAEKPVGTVWIGLVGPSGGEVEVRKFVFPGNRQMIRQRAAQMALAMLRWKLMGVAMPV